MFIPRWFSLLCCIIVNGQVWANAYSYNVLYVHLCKYFQGQSLHASLIGSLIFGLIMLLSIAVTPVMKRVPLRWLYAFACLSGASGPLLSTLTLDIRHWYGTFVIPMSISGTIFFTLSFCVAAMLYPKHTPIACSLVSGCTGIFTLIFPYFWEVGMSHLGLHKTLYVYSGFFGVLLLGTVAMPPRYKCNMREKSITKDAASDLIGSHLSIAFPHNDCKHQLRSRQIKSIKNICQRNVIIWTTANIIACIMFYCPFVHIMECAKRTFVQSSLRSMPEHFTISGLTSVVNISIAIGSMLSKGLFAFLCQRRILKSVYLFQLGLVVFGLSQTLLGLFPWITLTSFSSVFFIFITLCFFMGAGEGPFFALMLPVTFDISGPNKDPTTFTFVCSAISIPLVMGGPVGERLVHLTGNYSITFFVTGAAFLIASNIMFFIKHDEDTDQEIMIANSEEIEELHA